MLLFYSIFLFSFIPIAQTKIISCFGFVTSEIPIDKSLVQIKLFTNQGNLKYETECNPTDGFYTIPVYNRGKYRIKVYAPDGWIFEQDTQEIDVTTDSDEGVCDKDINFVLRGFVVSGVVRSGEAPGPDNFRLALYNAKDGTLITSTVTEEGGRYEFKTKPGSYEISTEGGSSQCINQGKIHVDVENSPVKVTPDIQISGYNLKVEIFDDKNTVRSNAHVTLTSTSQLQLSNGPVNAVRPSETHDKNSGGWLYSLNSDAEGVARFYCLPPGVYSLSAKWSDANVELNFDKPATVKINFKAEEVVLRAKSFNLRGEISTNSLPMPDATIFLNGVKKAQSDSSGNYVLRDLTQGTYQLSAQKQHYEFSPIETQLSSSTNANPSFSIKKIELCGSIDLSINSNFKTVDVIVRTTSSVVARISLDGENRFCQMLAPGDYLVEPLTSSYSFNPKSVHVNLKNAPVLNVKFTQFKALVEGSVISFESKNVVIQLVHQGEIVDEISTNSAFKFVDVVPGSYSVQIRDDYNFWWERQHYSIEITDKNIAGLKFLQTGYKVEIQSSHPVIIRYAPFSEKRVDSSEQLSASLIDGVNVVFFPQSGKYTFNVESCHKFDAQKILIVPAADRLVLNAVETQLSASVVTNHPSGDGKFSLAIKRQSTGEEFVVNESNEHHDAKQLNHSFTFYISQQFIGETFALTPRSDKYIFRPLSSQYTFDGECHSDIAQFQSEIGKVISGSVVPPVEGVEVKIVHVEDENVRLDTKTDRNGKFSVGPVWNLDDYDITLSKEGYEFKQRSPGEDRRFDYTSVKLSHLKVLFTDMETSKPLEEVLVSISGPENYRSSSVTDASGVLSIIGLPSGEYFVRPILQEYKFNATSFSLIVKEGQLLEVTLTAKKFAYSAFGKVTTISRQPFNEMVKVEAVSKQCNNHQEEDATNEKTASFRLRGLWPQCLYRIILKDDNGRRIASYPPFVEVLIGSEDKYDINFIVTPTENQMTVLGKIDFRNHRVSGNSYRVMLYQTSTGNAVQETVVQSPASVFMFTNLTINRMNYSAGLDRSEARRLGIEVKSVDFLADSSFKYVKLSAVPERKTSEVEVSKTNCFGLAIVVLITLWFLNQDKAKGLVDILVDNLQTILNHNNVVDHHSTDVDALRRRKPKKM